MKSTTTPARTFFARQFKPLILAVFILFASLNLYSQESSPKAMQVYPSFGVGIGFFYPSDVNDFIQYDIESHGYTEGYNTSLYMFIEVHAGVTFRVKRADFGGSLVYDIGPKYAMVENGSGSLAYGFNRITPLITGNYYIPIGSGRNALFIGGGVGYSFMQFRQFSASSPALKLQAGFSMQFGKFNLQPYAAFNYAKATDNSVENWENFDLDFTSGQVGVILSFHPGMNYK